MLYVHIVRAVIQLTTGRTVPLCVHACVRACVRAVYIADYAV